MRKHARKPELSGLLLTVALVLAACGGAGEDQQSGSDGDMQGTDQGGNTAAEQTTGGTTEEMLAENGEYSDQRFIDEMVPHHEGAVEMAEVALENAEHEEIRRLAEDIVSAQRAEIGVLRGIREREFGAAEPAMEMPEEEMNDTMDMADPRELANAEPFDRAFIDAMIPHHESAIEMAKVALDRSENKEIQTLARDILEAQRREIQQMNAWRERWYPAG